MGKWSFPATARVVSYWLRRRASMTKLRCRPSVGHGAGLADPADRLLARMPAQAAGLVLVLAAMQAGQEVPEVLVEAAAAHRRLR